jgi:hypothetical protein
MNLFHYTLFLILYLAVMSAKSLGKRKRWPTWPIFPSHTNDKCNYCWQNLPKHAQARKAHELICMETDDASDSVSEVEGDEVFIDNETDLAADEPYQDLQDVNDWIEGLAQRDTLSPEHMLKFMNWSPQPLTLIEENVAEFLGTVTSGTGMSNSKVNKLLKLWNKNSHHNSLPQDQETCWNIVEEAHARMTASLVPQSVTVPIPPEVQRLLYEPLESVTWQFCNPCELLIRMLTMGPLAAMPSAFALFPVESEYLDDFCHGEKMKRIYDAIPRNTCALSSILFFDEINRDQKGYATGDGAIVVGGFFTKEARNSTYAKAAFGTFPKLQIPKVRSIVAGN